VKRRDETATSLASASRPVDLRTPMHTVGDGRYATSVALPLVTVVAGLLALSIGVAAGRTFAA
jgi:hypothetical protein